jgi:hypothetical protein
MEKEKKEKQEVYLYRSVCLNCSWLGVISTSITSSEYEGKIHEDFYKNSQEPHSTGVVRVKQID